MAHTTLSDEIKRTGEARVEIFKLAITLSAQQREVFRKDPSGYLKQLFEKQGHKVNGFDVTTAFESKVNRLLDKTPKDSSLKISGTVYHQVEGPMISHYI
jgi:hypothetical protein